MRTTIGVSLAALCLLLLPAPGSGGSVDEPAVIAGTVFREPGFALPGAQVVLAVKTPPAGTKTPKTQKSVCNSRGEFAFKVPPLKAEYTVTAAAEGFVPEVRTAAVSGGPERVDLYFNLKPVR